MKAYINATVWTGFEYIEEAQLVINGGKIEAIGHDVTIPSEAEIIDLSGKYVTPGLIDVHTHLGVHPEGLGIEGHDFNETSDASTPYVRSLDGISLQDKSFIEAMQNCKVFRKIYRIIVIMMNLLRRGKNIFFKVTLK